MLDLCRTLYRHRELIGILVAKQLKLRYRGTVLGFVWTLLSPLLLMLVYTLVFSVYFRLDMERYPAFLFTGLLPWMWFASSLQQGVTSILDGAGLVTRSQFPAEVLPVVTVVANTVNFLLTCPYSSRSCSRSRCSSGPPLLFLPVLIALEFLLGLGLVLIGVRRERPLPRPPAHHPPPAHGAPVPDPGVLSNEPHPGRPPAVGVRESPRRPHGRLSRRALSGTACRAGRALLGLFVLTCVVLSLATAMFNRYKQTLRRGAVTWTPSSSTGSASASRRWCCAAATRRSRPPSRTSARTAPERPRTWRRSRT